MTSTDVDKLNRLLTAGEACEARQLALRDAMADWKRQAQAPVPPSWWQAPEVVVGGIVVGVSVGTLLGAIIWRR